MNSLIRAGIVSTVNSARYTVRVTFPDKQGLVSDELPLVAPTGLHRLPSVGDSVLCLFLGNGIRAGFCLGVFYTDSDTPIEVVEE